MTQSPTLICQRAHPRVCGADVLYGGGVRDDKGSSPRVRGRRSTRPSRVRSTRLIPACAGQTWKQHCKKLARRAHPRVCGADVRGDP